MAPTEEDTWRQHVLFRLDEQKMDHKEVRLALDEIKLQLAQLKVRAGIWGAVAGAIPVIAALLLRML